MSFKRTKVVMLSTNEKAEIGFLTQKGKERGHLVHFDRPMPIILDSENQHLYFLSDDEIKEGDWCVNLAHKLVVKPTDIEWANSNKDNLKKIIATTDKLEIPYQFDKWSIIPQPSEGFIQKFVDSYNSGNPITEVMVEYDFIRGVGAGFGYKSSDIDSLKINPKDNTITTRKVKDVWTRDEVATLILQSNLDSHVAKEGEFDIMHWIEENL